MSSFFRVSLLSAVIACAIAAPSAQAVDKLTTDKDKASYMVGIDIANNLKQIKDEIDVNIMIQAMQTTLASGKSLLSDEEAQKVREDFRNKMQASFMEKQKVAAEKNKADGDKFLAANKSKPGVKTTASGLQYQVVTQGKGAMPKATDQVKVHYVGTLLDGTEFDSSIKRGTPAQFGLNGVIPGWTEGLQLMPVGSKFKFFIPSGLAYGDRGTPGPIGPNATLIFEVELLEIIKPEAAQPQTPAPEAAKQ
jgi:FKBP-type peptidyl-prolyl cis-trans isomerase FkpA